MKKLAYTLLGVVMVLGLTAHSASYPFLGSGSNLYYEDVLQAFGFGTTTPTAVLSIMASTTSTQASRQFVFSIGSTSPLSISGKPQTTLLGIDTAGRFHASSTRPTVSSCGTSPTIVGGDGMGRVTVGTGIASACLITFAQSWGNAPFCIVTPGGGTGGAYKPYITLSATTSATTLNVMGISTTTGAIGTPPRINQTVFHYYCQGNIE